MDTAEVFREAYDRTMVFEGHYSDNSADPGGETFMGISRNWYPSWEGWAIIDRYGPKNMPDNTLDSLHVAVKQFYLINFWDRIQGDKIAKLSVDVAIKMFDTAVNLGVSRAVTFLQEALNLLNINKRLYAELTVDGKLGARTMDTLTWYMHTRPGTPDENERRLLTVYSFLQGGHYIALMKKHPTMEVFRGWFDRAAIV